MGYQCGRCGTRYGWIPPTPPPETTEEAAVRRAMTQKTIMSGYRDIRRVLLATCVAGKCPTTARALLWRLFGKRGGGCTGKDWRPGLKHALRSLRRGDPLLLE